MVSTWAIRPQIIYSRFVPSTESFRTGLISPVFSCYTPGGYRWPSRAWIGKCGARVLGPLAYRPGGCSILSLSGQPRWQQSHTIPQHSYGTGGFWHDLDHLLLGVRTRLQRAHRAQTVIHLTWCVFETRRNEDGPLRRGIGGCKQSFPIPRRPPHPCERTAALFFQPLMVSTPERPTLIYMQAHLRGVQNPSYFHLRPTLLVSLFNEPLHLGRRTINYDAAGGETIWANLMR